MNWRLKIVNDMTSPEGPQEGELDTRRLKVTVRTVLASPLVQLQPGSDFREVTGIS